MRALIIGVGSIGSRHLRNLRALRPTWDISVVRPTHPGVLPDGADAVFESLDCAYPETATIGLVCTPAPTHLGLARQLVSLGVDVFVEKPISDRVLGMKELMNCAQQRKTMIFQAYPLRYHSGVQCLRELVSAGQLGELHVLRAEVGQHLADWRPGQSARDSISARFDSGGGALLELSHELDLARMLMGDVDQVTALARSSAQLNLPVEDHAEILLRFRSGALGSLHLDMLSRPARRRIEISGSRATAELDLCAGTLCLTTSRLEKRTLWASDSQRELDAMYVAELEGFLECVVTRAAPNCSAEDGLAALRIARAAARSARCGRSIRP